MLKSKVEDYICRFCKKIPEHLFKDCQSAKCTCKCVRQLRKDVLVQLPEWIKEVPWRGSKIRKPYERIK